MPGQIHKGAIVAVGALIALVAFFDTAHAQDRLSALNIDPERVSISGISSGAFMANQVHVAHAELIMGAGLVAGGLHGCAVLQVDEDEGRLESSISRALDRCMAGRGALPPVARHVERIHGLAEAGWIDPPAELAGDRVYLFAGRADDVVDPATVAHAAEVYRAAGVRDEDLRFQRFLDAPPTEEGAGHAWLTKDCCQPCAAHASPYINDCDHDQAGAILRHIYGDLEPPAGDLSGEVTAFSQVEFAPGGETARHGLNESGRIYVPRSCADGETCALHVVLHGCSQSAEVLGNTFYTSIGVNEWADSNGIVVLYPQARSVARSDLDAAYPDRFFRNAWAVNPSGCWNWWGYAYDERFALKQGVQVSAIYAMIRRLMGAEDE